MARRREVLFASEAALCARFIEGVTRDGRNGVEWIVYQETGGFDILLSRKSDGAQVGIEAKLALNVDVVTQALPRWRWDCGVTGPDYRAVLVPQNATGGLEDICLHLGITILRCCKMERAVMQPVYYPKLPGSYELVAGSEWMDWCPVERIKLPDYIPDVSAGHKAPVKLTDWKIKAIKIAIILETRPVTRADFKAIKIDPSRWTNAYNGWLNKDGKGGYVRSHLMPDFKAQHPVNYEQIRADAAKWMPPGAGRTGDLDIKG